VAVNVLYPEPKNSGCSIAPLPICAIFALVSTLEQLLYRTGSGRSLVIEAAFAMRLAVEVFHVRETQRRKSDIASAAPLTLPHHKE
jgi:hypothetical protein